MTVLLHILHTECYFAETALLVDSSEYHSTSCSVLEPLIYVTPCVDIIVDIVTGRPSCLEKVGCQFVGDDDLTGALHVL